MVISEKKPELGAGNRIHHGTREGVESDHAKKVF